MRSTLPRPGIVRPAIVRPTIVRRGAALLSAVVLVAACSGGGDITDSGDGGSESTAPGETLAPTTSVAPDSLPDCPTDALAGATGTVEITFWHGMSGPLGEELTRLTDEYNASQDRVKVTLVGESYEETNDKFLQSDQDSRADLVQMPEYMVQAAVDTDASIPVGQCITDAGFDTSAFLPSAMSAYATEGVQWAMPFNVSNPVLFYNKRIFEAAGLDPDVPPASLEDVRTMSQAIVDSGAGTYGIAVESGFDSGGGWYVEQWFAKAQQFYVDADNGRSGRATSVLYNDELGVEVMTWLQQMVTDGLAVNVGDNSASGYDNLLKMADAAQPAAMTIATSASLGPVLDVLGEGTYPHISASDVGVGPMPGPDGAPGALIGGAALWMMNHDDPVRAAATWDYVAYLVGAQQQAEWAVATGYVPVRTDARDLEPLAGTLAADPRFAVAYEQLLSAPDAPTSAGPWAATMPSAAAAEDALAAHGLASGALRSARELADTEWSAARGATVHIDDRGSGTIQLPNSPWHFSRSDTSLRGPVRYRGEDNRDVLVRLAGLSDADVDRLERDGVLSSRVPAPGA